MAVNSGEHLVTVIREDSKGVANLLPKWEPVPLVRVYDQVAEETLIGAVDSCNVFVWLQNDFLRCPTWGSVFLTPGRAISHLDTERKGEL